MSSSVENNGGFGTVASIRRMIDNFFNTDLIHDDLTNPLVILGTSYTPRSRGKDGNKDNKHSDNDEPADQDQGQDQIGKENMNDSSFLMVVDDGDSSSSSSRKTQWPTEFINDIRSKIWITYRTGFPAIAVSDKNGGGPSPLTLSVVSFLRSGTINDFNSGGFTSDVGWGCMIRTSQMLLANALLISTLGRDWRITDSTTQQQEQQNDENSINALINNFADLPTAKFSIHNFLEEGLRSGKHPGEWFGPTAASRSIQFICNDRLFKDDSTDLKVYLTEDGGDIYETDFFNIMDGGGGASGASDTSEPKKTTTPVLLLSPLRLGVDSVNSLYWDSLKKSLAIPQAVGIAGGRPKSSHYFFGFQGDYLFYFDPHLPQKGSTDEKGINYDTYRTTSFKKLHLKDMDPSMLIGFLIKDHDDFHDWKKSMQENSKLFHFNNLRKTPSAARMREPSVVEMGDDEEFIDLGYGLDENENENDNENEEESTATSESTNTHAEVAAEPKVQAPPIQSFEADSSIGMDDAEIVNLPNIKDNEDQEEEVMGGDGDGVSATVSASSSASAIDEERELSTDPIMVEERRFSEPILVDKDELSSNNNNNNNKSSQVFEDLN